MKILKIFLIILCITCLTLLVSCKSDSEISGNSDIIHSDDLSTDINEDYYYFDWQNYEYTSIDLSQGNVTITSSGIYELHGTIEDGTITVNVDKSVDKETVFLVLNNATINSASGTPINIIEDKKVTIILENDAKNYVNQGLIETTDEDFPSAAIYSKADLGITGSGYLYVTTLYNDGITSKDNLIITSRNIVVDAAYDGIVGKDTLVIESGNINITCGKDGLRSTNSEDATKGNLIIIDGSITINAKNDGIQSENNIQIIGGTIDIKTNGGYPGSSIKNNDTNGNFNRPNNFFPTSITTTESDSTSDSYKGIKAEGYIKISGGNLSLSVYEDGIHAAGNIDIVGGNIVINAGDDGIHSDTNVYISSRTLSIENCYEGVEAYYEIIFAGGSITINSSDDGINVSQSSGVIKIEGGKLSITSVGDGIDSNGDLTITGGEIIINQSTIGQMDSALDYDGKLTFTGGTIINQDGTTIDPTVAFGPGGNNGFGGGKGNQTKPTQTDNTFPSMPNDNQIPSGATTKS